MTDFQLIQAFAEAQKLIADLRSTQAGINHAAWTKLFRVGTYLGDEQKKMFDAYFEEAA